MPWQGLETLKDPQGLGADPNAKRICRVCVVQNWHALWGSLWWDAKHDDAILVACVVALDYYIDWDTSAIYQVHAQPAPGYPTAGTAEG